MAEFFQLSAAERLDALNAVADISGLPPHLPATKSQEKKSTQ